ncbi:hypothetical protein LINPERPRIM_LOCUS35745 [Linum perenne]
MEWKASERNNYSSANDSISYQFGLRPSDWSSFIDLDDLHKPGRVRFKHKMNLNCCHLHLHHQFWVQRGPQNLTRSLNGRESAF